MFEIMTFVALIGVYKAVMAIIADKNKRKIAKEEFEEFEKEHPSR